MGKLSSSWKEPSELSPKGKKGSRQRRGQGSKEGETVPADWPKLQDGLEWLKKKVKAAALCPVNCESWSKSRTEREITISRQCELLGRPDPRCTTKPIPVALIHPGDHGQDRCAVFGGSNSEAVGWFQVFVPEEGIPNRVTVSEPSCAHGFSGPSTRSHAPTVPGDPSEPLFPAWWTSRKVTEWDQGFGQQIYLYPLLRRASSTWWPLWDLFSRQCTQLETFQTALDMEFCLEAWKLLLPLGESPQIFYSRSGVSVHPGDFVARLQDREIKISWSGRGRCYDNILVENLEDSQKYEEMYLRA